MKKVLLEKIGRLYQVLTKQGKQRYLLLKWRLLLAVPMALLMVLIGKRWEWIVKLVSNHFGLLLVSTLGSYSIVASVSGFAHWAHRWLDAQFDWRTDFRSRLIAQLALPLAGGWILSILMAIGLYGCFGIDINASGYLRFEVWIVLFLLALMNTGYAFWYLHKQPAGSEHETAHVEVTNQRNEKLHVSELDIGCIQAASGWRLVRMIDGEIYYTSKSIIELEKILDSQRYYKLKRRYLVNMAIIEKLSKEKKTIKNKETGVETTEYRWILNFGNGQMGKFQEKLVKGTVKHFETWWKAKWEKKNRK